MILQGEKLKLNSAVSERVLKILVENNLNQVEFSREIDVPATTINGNINNKSLWQIDTLKKIVDKYGISYDYLMAGRTNPESEELLRYKNACNVLKSTIKILLNDKQPESSKQPETVYEAERG